MRNYSIYQFRYLVSVLSCIRYLVFLSGLRIFLSLAYLEFRNFLSLICQYIRMLSD